MATKHSRFLIQRKKSRWRIYLMIFSILLLLVFPLRRFRYTKPLNNNASVTESTSDNSTQGPDRRQRQDIRLIPENIIIAGVVDGRQHYLLKREKNPGHYRMLYVHDSVTIALCQAVYTTGFEGYTKPDALIGLVTNIASDPNDIYLNVLIAPASHRCSGQPK